MITIIKKTTGSILLFTIFFACAEPEKRDIVGMSEMELIQLMGEPSSRMLLTTSDSPNSISVLEYPNDTKITIQNGKVESVNKEIDLLKE
jgi:hypothetical protein